MTTINCFIMLISTAFTIASAPPIDIVFIIQNPTGTRYHNELSHNLKGNINKQAQELEPNYRIRVHLLDEILNYPGDWTIHNVIPKLMLLQRKSYINSNMQENKQIESNIINDNTRWIVFCEAETRINVKLLMEKLNGENHTKALYLGHALYDGEPTIIHHFAFFENPKWFPYPMLRAGVIFSMPLLKSIAHIYNNHKKNNNLQQHSTLLQRSEFSIDAAHELALFIYDNVQISTETKSPTQQNYENNRDIKSEKLHANKSHHTTAHINPKEKPTTSSKEPMYNDDVADNSSSVTVAKDKRNKSKKIILKKASYICPMAAWETGSMNNKYIGNVGKSKNKNNKYDKSECAMYAEPSLTCTPIKNEEIYFAVKTCSKYHSERLPIIQNTWGQYAKHIKYFSDIQDDIWPTINTGVSNVEMGHCAKTLQILKLALRHIENHNQKHAHLYHLNQVKHENHQIKWLFLADDDTLISISGVCQVLGCYNSMNEIYLGERYGYRLHAKDGFNYITGGGGMAFSLPVVKLILQHCSCPSPSAPDDMILGSCLHTLQVKALHSSRFHQARPNDYSLDLLQLEQPVSFHKFWQHDPIETYNHWFAVADRQFLTEENRLPENSLQLAYRSKTRKLLAKTDSLDIDEMPVNLMASLHHTKERHLDL